MATRQHDLDWPEVRNRFLAIASGDDSGGDSEQLKRFGEQWRLDASATWRGASLAQMTEWLHSGYDVTAAAGVDMAPVAVAPKRRLKFADEGEVQADLALAGFDEPFLSWQKRPRRPGMAIDIGFDFAGSVAARPLGEYALWLARLVYRFESDGYDLQIRFVMSGHNTYKSSGHDKIVITVKREGELSDFRDWSAILSPGGYRYLGFTALCMGGEKLGSQATSGLGSPDGTDWRVKFDAGIRLLTISCPATISTFDASHLDGLLAKAIGGGA